MSNSELTEVVNWLNDCVKFERTQANGCSERKEPLMEAVHTGKMCAYMEARDALVHILLRNPIAV